MEACDWNPSGTGGCNDLNSCLGACPALPEDGSGSAATCPSDSGITCVDGCFHDSSQQAVDLLFDWLDCLDANCQNECFGTGTSTECNTCDSQYCSTQNSACASN